MRKRVTNKSVYNDRVLNLKSLHHENPDSKRIIYRNNKFDTRACFRITIR